MGREVSRWIADDGAEFSSKKEMLLHEMSRLDEQEIELFLTVVVRAAPRKLAEYTKLLNTWQAHLRTQQLEEVEVVPATDDEIEAELSKLLSSEYRAFDDDSDDLPPVSM